MRCIRISILHRSEAPSGNYLVQYLRFCHSTPSDFIEAFKQKTRSLISS